MNTGKKISILETTLRDGSYAINFQFSAKDTAVLCKKLEEAGFEYIEIGHGVGLNGSEKHGQALQSDEEYLEAAQNALSTAKFGMFCIPDIARLEDIDMAARYGMNFIRIGANVTEYESAQPYIDRAKKYDMFVAANFMKSYCLQPSEFAQKVKLAEDFGADLAYLVDSAGGMFPADIKNYYKAVREISEIEMGFHGHNNLDLAIANSLEAVDVGYTFVDTSLQGMGRSAGNAGTEILAASMIKLGIPISIDLLKVLDLGLSYINPMIERRGNHPLDVITGFADFHSSYMKLIHKYSSKYSVDPAILINEITKISKVDVDEKKLDELASSLEKDENIYTGKYSFNRYIGNEQG